METGVVGLGQVGNRGPGHLRSKRLGRVRKKGLGQLGGKRPGQNQRGMMNRGVRDRNPVDRQRGPPIGLGITALTPTLRAVILGDRRPGGIQKKKNRKQRGQEAQDRQGAKKCAPE